MPDVMAGEASTQGVEAWFFDGQTSQPQAVVLSVEGGALHLRRSMPRDGEDPLLLQPLPLSCLAIDEPLGNTRRIDIAPSFWPGAAAGAEAYCEAREGPALDAMLTAMGYRASRVLRWQGSLRAALVALVGVSLLLSGLYFWGLQPLAAGVARLVPERARHALDTAVIESFEKTRMLLPSRIPLREQEEIRAGLEKLAWPGGTAKRPEIRLHFYSAPAIGANAFALPGGRVVVTDELVKLSAGSPGVLAVLGHEAGHVVHGHGLRQMVEASVIGVVVGLWLGDFSSTVAGLSTLVLQNKYSREDEREADDYGVAVMKLSGLPPTLLADMLEKLERAHEARHGEKRADTDLLEKLLSSHPETAERIRRIRGGT